MNGIEPAAGQASLSTKPESLEQSVAFHIHFACLTNQSRCGWFGMPATHPRTAASIAAMSILICFIIAAIALADTSLSALVVNSVSRFGKTCHETP